MLRTLYGPYLAGRTIPHFGLTISTPVASPPEPAGAPLPPPSILLMHLIAASRFARRDRGRGGKVCAAEAELDGRPAGSVRMCPTPPRPVPSSRARRPPRVSAFQALQKGPVASMPPVLVQYRADETVYIAPKGDRVVVVFSVIVREPSDRAIVRVFLQVRALRTRGRLAVPRPHTAPPQEFADAQRGVNHAPPVTFSREPPKELAGGRLLESPTDPSFLGYISFGTHPRHCAAAAASG